MTDEKFEKFLSTAAQSYNQPPVHTPREEMWKAIQAERAAGPQVVYGGGSVAAVTAKRFERKIWWGAAAAAVLLVASGVGIGRWTASPDAPSGAVAVPTKPAIVVANNQPESAGVGTNPGPATEGPGTSQGQNVASSGATPAGSGVASSGVSSQKASGRSTTSGRNTNGNVATQLASGQCAVIRGCGQPAPAGAETAPHGGNSAYQMVAAHHLSSAEALLTSFRSRSAADQQMDAQIGIWARELLTNTRLLLDSPIGTDPQRRPLLEDLELVLVQIVQLSPGSTPQDREMIEKTLQQDHVLTRLRTAIPAGAQRGS
jgi:hypothetical protein